MVLLNISFSIDFSIDNEGQIEHVFLINGDINQERSEDLIKLLVEKGVIEIGERSKGIVELKDSVIHTDYEICIEIGTDWENDIWVEKSRKDQLFTIY